MVKLVSFAPFQQVIAFSSSRRGSNHGDRGAAQALENANEISEGIVSEYPNLNTISFPRSVPDKLLAISLHSSKSTYQKRARRTK